jgi:hypothetical protein
LAATAAFSRLSPETRHDMRDTPILASRVSAPQGREYSMRPRLALTIGAVVAFSREAEILSRDLGVTLLGLGVLNWMTRGATGAPLRGVLVGNIAIQVLEIGRRPRLPPRARRS